MQQKNITNNEEVFSYRILPVDEMNAGCDGRNRFMEFAFMAEQDRRVFILTIRR